MARPTGLGSWTGEFRRRMFCARCGGIAPSLILGRDAAGTADASGKGVFETAVGQGERLSGSETLAAGGRDVHSSAQPGPEAEGTWHTSAPAEEVVASPARVATAETDTRRVAFENRSRQGGSRQCLSPGRSSFAQCARTRESRDFHFFVTQRKTSSRHARRGALSAAVKSLQ